MSKLGHTKGYELLSSGRVKSVLIDGKRLVFIQSWYDYLERLLEEQSTFRPGRHPARWPLTAPRASRATAPSRIAGPPARRRRRPARTSHACHKSPRSLASYPRRAPPAARSFRGRDERPPARAASLPAPRGSPRRDWEIARRSFDDLANRVRCPRFIIAADLRSGFVNRTEIARLTEHFAHERAPLAFHAATPVHPKVRPRILGRPHDFGEPQNVVPALAAP